MKRICLFLAFNIILTCASAQLPQKSIAHCKSYYIESFLDGKRLSTASCFFAKYKNDFYLVTNWHVLTGKDINGRFKDPDKKVPNKYTMYYYNVNRVLNSLTFYFNDKWLQFTDATQMPLDIAVLKVNRLMPCFYNNELEVNTDFMVGDSCFSLCYPKEIAGKQFTPQKINGKIYPGSKKVNNIYSPDMMFHSGIFTDGTSGAPIYNMKGKLIGIHVGFAGGNGNGDTLRSFYTKNAIIRVIEKGKPF